MWLHPTQSDTRIEQAASTGMAFASARPLASRTVVSWEATLSSRRDKYILVTQKCRHLLCTISIIIPHNESLHPTRCELISSPWSWILRETLQDSWLYFLAAYTLAADRQPADVVGYSVGVLSIPSYWIAPESSLSISSRRTHQGEVWRFRSSEGLAICDDFVCAFYRPV